MDDSELDFGFGSPEDDFGDELDMPPSFNIRPTWEPADRGARPLFLDGTAWGAGPMSDLAYQARLGMCEALVLLREGFCCTP